MFVIAAVCVLSATAFDIKSYTGTASQAEVGTSNYTFCDLTSGDVLAVTAEEQAKITIVVTSSVGDCGKLEPGLTDQEFADRFDLLTRVYYMADLDADGNLLFNQYGDEGCQYIQRTIPVEWDASGNTCTDAGVSAGILAEYFFSNANCSDYSADDLKFAFLNDNAGIENMMDPWALVTAAINNTSYNWTVNADKHVRYNTFVSDGNIVPSSYCYGIGEMNAPPLGYPTISNGTYYHDIYAPIPGVGLCAFPCKDLILGALANATVFGAYAAYGGAAAGGNETAIGLALMGLSEALGAFFSDNNGEACYVSYSMDGAGAALLGLMAEMATPVACDTCITMNPATSTIYQTVGAIAATTGIAPPVSKMGICRTDTARAWVHMTTMEVVTLTGADGERPLITYTIAVAGAECADFTAATLTSISNTIAEELGVKSFNVDVTTDCAAKQTEVNLAVAILPPKNHSVTVNDYAALSSQYSTAATAVLEGDAGASLLNEALGGDSNVTVTVTEGAGGGGGSPASALSYSMLALFGVVYAMLV